MLLREVFFITQDTRKDLSTGKMRFEFFIWKGYDYER